MAQTTKIHNIQFTS